MKWIFKEKFLARAVDAEPYSRFTSQARKRAGLSTEKPKQLYVAGLDTLIGIENLCLTMKSCGVTLLFVDNPARPSYSPELQVTGTHTNLLKALAYFCKSRNAPGDVHINSNTMFLWWD